MDKNTVIGLVLIGAILLGFSVYNNNQQQKFKEAKAIADSINRANVVRLNEQTDNVKTETDSLQAEFYEQQLSSSLGDHLYSSLTGVEELYTIDNEVMEVTFTNKGGQIHSVKLKDYNKWDGEPLYMFDSKNSNFDLSFFSNQQINTSKFYFTPQQQQDVTINGEVSQNFAMRLYMDSLSYLEYLYTIHPDNHMIDFKIRMTGMDNFIARNQSDFIINWNTETYQNEKGFDNENNYSNIAYMFPNDNSLEKIGERTKNNVDKSVNSKIKWVAFKQQFFSSILIADDAFLNGVLDVSQSPEAGKLKNYHAQLALPYSPNITEYDMHFYFGPNKFNILKKCDIGAEKLVPLGWGIIGWINRLVVIPTFDFLSKFIDSYGLIILLLTIFIKILIFPLTYKSYLSQAKMRAIKPEIDALGEKYPDQKDAMKKQQATMELYRSAGINPLGGCLPLLIQMPILMAMFRFFPASIELRAESFLWASDLSTYDSILDLPFNIPFYGDHVSLFTLLMAVSMFITSRISYNQTASSAPQMAGMKFMMLYMMPLMMIVWFNNYSSGLSLYWLMSNIITMGQTLGFRYAIDESKLHQKMKENAKNKKPKKKSKFMQRYEDALKQQQEVQRRQQQNKK